MLKAGSSKLTDSLSSTSKGKTYPTITKELMLKGLEEKRK
jgi:hypothetical protein